MARREQKSDSDKSSKTPSKPKSNSRPRGRKGVILDRLIGSGSGYKTATSRHFRRNLEALTNRGPAQEVVQATKAQYNLNEDFGRNAWALHRVLLFGADGRGNS